MSVSWYSNDFSFTNILRFFIVLQIPRDKPFLTKQAVEDFEFLILF